MAVSIVHLKKKSLLRIPGKSKCAQDSNVEKGEMISVVVLGPGLKLICNYGLRPH